MNKIPTAEEFVQTHPIYFPSYTTGAYEGLIEFAKLHVQAALEAASKVHLSGEIDEWAFDKMGEEILSEKALEYNIKQILNAYPLNNVK